MRSHQPTLVAHGRKPFLPGVRHFVRGLRPLARPEAARDGRGAAAASLAPDHAGSDSGSSSADSSPLGQVPPDVPLGPVSPGVRVRPLTDPPLSSATGPRVVALVKQVPYVEELELGPDGRLLREGLALELNPYCRRAVTKAVELAAARNGHCVVITLGPEAAEDSLREAIACGADYGILVTDPAFRGSDTYATANALAAAIGAIGGSDLILVGRNSVDADTGQVGPAVAEALGHGFLGSVRTLEFHDDAVLAGCQQDDRWTELKADLPLVISCAERLCEPAKAPREARAAVASDRLYRLGANDLGPGPWGEAGSLTVVGPTKLVVADRAAQRLEGDVESNVRRTVDYLVSRGVLPVAAPADEPPAREVSSAPPGTESAIIVVLEPERPRLQRELLGAASALAAQIGSTVVALAYGEVDPEALSSWGADELVSVEADEQPSCDQVADVLAAWADQHQPWAILLGSTSSGREIGSRAAFRIKAGMAGDAVELEVGPERRLVAWKPAFSGRLLAAITATSPIQVASVRSGVVGLRPLRAAPHSLPVTTVSTRAQAKVTVVSSSPEEPIDDLLAAATVVGVGQGVDPAGYDVVHALCATLGAELAATRKVTDKGWVSHSRQVGITGVALSPDIYIAIGISGRANHMLGVENAGVLVAINSDRKAAIFDQADIGIVARWQDVVPVLIRQLAERGIDAGSSGVRETVAVEGKTS